MGKVSITVKPEKKRDIIGHEQAYYANTDLEDEKYGLRMVDFSLQKTL